MEVSNTSTAQCTHWFDVCLQNCTISELYLNLWEAWSLNLVCSYILVTIVTNLSWCGADLGPHTSGAWLNLLSIHEAELGRRDSYENISPSSCKWSSKSSWFMSKRFGHNLAKWLSEVYFQRSCYLVSKWICCVFSCGQLYMKKEKMELMCLFIYSCAVCPHTGRRSALNAPHSFLSLPC